MFLDASGTRKSNLGKPKAFNDCLNFSSNMAPNSEFLDMLVTERKVYLTFSWKEEVTRLEHETRILGAFTGD